MAWNSDPQIRDLANWAKKHGYSKVVAVVFVNDDRCGYVSYGKNAKLCADARKIGDKIYEAGQQGLFEKGD